MGFLFILPLLDSHLVRILRPRMAPLRIRPRRRVPLLRLERIQFLHRHHAPLHGQFPVHRLDPRAHWRRSWQRNEDPARLPLRCLIRLFQTRTRIGNCTYAADRHDHLRKASGSGFRKPRQQTYRSRKLSHGFA